MSTTLTPDSPPRAEATRSPRPLQPTLGPGVCRWMEANLVHGPGDRFGQPYRLEPYMREFVYRAYEVREDGSRIVTRALLGVAKGNAKTEFAAALGCAELGGPVVFSHWSKSGKPIGKRRVSPDIPIAAASFDQANLLFGCAAVMVREGPLKPYFDPFETEIQVKGSPGEMYRVAAVAGTNDGKRPTFFVADELHEWLGNKGRVHLVLSNGRAKRAQSWELSVTTAGWDTSSVLGQLYAYGQRVASGDIADESFLFRWYEPTLARDDTGKPVPVDLTDAVALRQAIRDANPASFVNVEAIAKRATEIPDHEFRRYHLNQWVDAPTRWLPAGAWESCADPARTIAPRTPVVLAVDGTHDGACTAIVGATVEAVPHLFTVHCWDTAAGGAAISTSEVEDLLQAHLGASAPYRVLRVALNPNRWRSTIDRLEEAGHPVLAWDSHLPARMVPACAQLYDAVQHRRLTQDGTPAFADHVSHAMTKVDTRGLRVVRDPAIEGQRVDLALAAVAAYDLAVREASADVPRITIIGAPPSVPTPLDEEISPWDEY